MIATEPDQARKEDIRKAVWMCGECRCPPTAVNESISFSTSLLWLNFWIKRETHCAGDIYWGQLSNLLKPDVSALLSPDTSSTW